MIALLLQGQEYQLSTGSIITVLNTGLRGYYMLIEALIDYYNCRQRIELCDDEEQAKPLILEEIGLYCKLKMLIEQHLDMSYDVYTKEEYLESIKYIIQYNTGEQVESKDETVVDYSDPATIKKNLSENYTHIIATVSEKLGMLPDTIGKRLTNRQAIELMKAWDKMRIKTITDMRYAQHADKKAMDGYLKELMGWKQYTIADMLKGD